jgi:hypothetical protein
MMEHKPTGPLGRIWVDAHKRLSLSIFVQMLTGKVLIGLGLGAWLAPWLAPSAGFLIVIGLVVDGVAKWRWFKGR